MRYISSKKCRKHLISRLSANPNLSIMIDFVNNGYFNRRLTHFSRVPLILFARGDGIDEISDENRRVSARDRSWRIGDITVQLDSADPIAIKSVCRE